jgi:hypothetical protein
LNAIIAVLGSPSYRDDMKKMFLTEILITPNENSPAESQQEALNNRFPTFDVKKVSMRAAMNGTAARRDSKKKACFLRTVVPHFHKARIRSIRGAMPHRISNFLACDVFDTPHIWATGRRLARTVVDSAMPAAEKARRMHSTRSQRQHRPWLEALLYH